MLPYTSPDLCANGVLSRHGAKAWLWHCPYIACMLMTSAEPSVSWVCAVEAFLQLRACQIWKHCPPKVLGNRCVPGNKFSRLITLGFLQEDSQSCHVFLMGERILAGRHCPVRRVATRRGSRGLEKHSLCREQYEMIPGMQICVSDRR